MPKLTELIDSQFYPVRGVGAPERLPQYQFRFYTDEEDRDSLPKEEVLSLDHRVAWDLWAALNKWFGPGE